LSNVWTIERHLEAGSGHGRALFHRFVHHFRVDSPQQMDARFGRWIADSYDQVGCGNR
jgi:hypothetical protein